MINKFVEQYTVAQKCFLTHKCLLTNFKTLLNHNLFYYIKKKWWFLIISLHCIMTVNYINAYCIFDFLYFMSLSTLSFCSRNTIITNQTCKHHLTWSCTVIINERVYYIRASHQCLSSDNVTPHLFHDSNVTFLSVREMITTTINVASVPNDWPDETCSCAKQQLILCKRSDGSISCSRSSSSEAELFKHHQSFITSQISAYHRCIYYSACWTSVLCCGMDLWCFREFLSDKTLLTHRKAIRHQFNCCHNSVSSLMV